MANAISSARYLLMPHIDLSEVSNWDFNKGKCGIWLFTCRAYSTIPAQNQRKNYNAIILDLRLKVP